MRLQTIPIRNELPLPATCSIADRIARWPSLMTAKVLAPMLDYDPKTLYAHAAAGKIPSIRMHGGIRFDPYDVAEWLRERAA